METIAMATSNASELKRLQSPPNELINKVTLGNCLEVMKQIEDNSVDLLVCDPPYNISQEGNEITRNNLDYKGFRRESNITLDFGSWDKRTDAEFEEFNENWIKEVVRVLKPKSWGYIFFAKEKIGLLEKLYKKYDLKYRTVISWCKSNPTPSFRKVNWVSAVEFISVFSKGEGKIKNFLTQQEMMNYIITPNKSSYGETIHPTEKPISVISRLIKTSSNEGDIVLDPFLGSGTTAVSCLMLKRKFIGIEQEQRYVDISNNRLKPLFEQRKLGD